MDRIRNLRTRKRSVQHWRRHSSRWANQILLAKFEICTHNYANASVFSVAEFRARVQPTPPRDNCETVQRLHVTLSAIYVYIYIFSSNLGERSIRSRNLDKSSGTNKYTRLNKYSTPIRDRHLFERLKSWKDLGESWREVRTHLCINVKGIRV